MGGTLEELKFDNLTLMSLAIDESKEPGTRTVRGANFSLVTPDPVKNPKLVAASPEALALLDLAPEQAERPELVEAFVGNKVLPGSQPAAHCYCGHQFGFFSGQLGDGAAMYLGEVVNQQGQRWELQLKGAGLTPYSRAADGRKVLRSSVREFLCSEAMYHLGIPTTRAATCITSDTLVVRDPEYSGRAVQEKATVVSRVAPTFLRFGSFEIFKPTDSTTGRTGSSEGLEAEMLPRMLRFTIRTYFPGLWAQHEGDRLEQQLPRGDEAGWHPLYRDWLVEVARRTGSLVAAWQSVGWVHGVLNTDNMSIVGITIDYGPFQFMDNYNPEHVSNGSDDSAFYNYSAQPSRVRWNVEKLGEAVRWAVPERIAKEALEAYDAEFERSHIALMRRKLGLVRVRRDEDLNLVTDLLQVMADAGSDWTNSWRALARVPLAQEPASNGAAPAHGDGAAEGTADAQLLKYLVSQSLPPGDLAAQRDSAIPSSNLQMLLMLATKDPATLHALGATPQQIHAESAKREAALKLRKMSPADKQLADREAWGRWLRRYRQRLALEREAGATEQERRDVMNSSNPRFVLRNWVAHSAIQQAEKGEFGEVRALLELLRDPFSTEGEERAFQQALADAERQGGTASNAPAGAAAAAAAAQADDYGAALPGPEEGGGASGACSLARQKFDRRPPAWARNLNVTCSS